MIKRGWILAAAIAAAALTSSGAKAASSIFYSESENVFGWCAGYATERAHRCAAAECRKRGGRSCRFVAGCQGPGAVAFSERPARAFGASCLGDAVSARRAALTGCMAAANTSCWTSTTFTSAGRAFAEASNRSFDQVWFAQLMMQSLRIYDGSTDGNMNEKTEAAIRTFEERIGPAAGGRLDEELFQRLIDAIGGSGNFARLVKRDLLPRLETQLAESGVQNRLFYTAVEAMPVTTTAQDFANRDPEARKLALATYLSARKTKCTLPARSALAVGDAFWSVACDEGTYTLIFTGDGHIVTSGGKS